MPLQAQALPRARVLPQVQVPLRLSRSGADPQAAHHSQQVCSPDLPFVVLVVERKALLEL